MNSPSAGRASTLAGARCLVTGGGSGIGAAIALALAARGARLALVGRTAAKLEEVAGRAAPPPALCWPADLADDEQVERLAERVEGELGGLEVLIHSAAVLALGPVGSAPVAELDAQYRTNLRAPYLLTQRLLPLLRAAQGQVVFVNSSSGLAARAEVGQYAATKHGLKALADSLRAEENERGVRVLSVYPGRTASPLQAVIHEWEGRPYRPERIAQPEDVAATIVAALELPRTAEVTDLQIRPMRKT